jgi:hypothetical protein
VVVVSKPDRDQVVAENGYGSPETFPEVAVLRSRP